MRTKKGFGNRNQHSDQEKQLQRISYYEAIMQELSAAVRSEDTTIEALKTLQSKAEELGAYLESDSWKQDFADDEAGHFPAGLKRGVLSEDGIFNLLESYRERIVVLHLDQEEYTNMGDGKKLNVEETGKVVGGSGEFSDTYTCPFCGKIFVTAGTPLDDINIKYHMAQHYLEENTK